MFVTKIQAEVIRLMNNNKSAKTIKNNIFFIGAVLNNNDIKIDMSKIAKPKTDSGIRQIPTPKPIFELLSRQERKSELHY